MVVLDEHQVPQLDEAPAVAVDAADVARPRPACRSASGPRSRWISLHGPHGPVSPISQKLSLRPKKRMCSGSMSVCLRQKPAASSSRPRSPLSSSKDRGPQPLLRQLPHLGQQLPGPGDGFFLVIVAERPVAQHLEQRVVVRRPAHILQVVVLAADAHALLRVGDAPGVGLAQAQEESLNWFMPALVKSSVGSSCGASEALGTIGGPCWQRNPGTAGGFPRWSGCVWWSCGIPLVRRRRVIERSDDPESPRSFRRLSHDAPEAPARSVSYFTARGGLCQRKHRSVGTKKNPRRLAAGDPLERLPGLLGAMRSLSGSSPGRTGSPTRPSAWKYSIVTK